MEKQEKIFRELKKKFTKEPMLAVSNLNKKISMEVDICDNITKKVLSIV